MKHILIIASFVFMLAGFSGCKRYLDLPPKNELTISSVTDVKAVLGAYLRGVATIFQKPLYGSIMPMAPVSSILLLESYSDNIDFEKALTQTYLQPNNSRLFATAEIRETAYANWLLWNDYSTPKFIWTNHYEVIGFLNTLIDKMNEITDASPAERDQLLGEMHIHRAYYFFKLLQYFAPYDKSALGIPVYLKTGQNVVGINTPRSSHADVYKVILEDLNKSLIMIDRTIPVAGYNIFYSKRYLNHILAQVYWFKAESPAKETTDYEKVKLHAQAALEAVDPLIPVTSPARYTAYGRTNTTYPAHYMENNLQGAISPLYGSERQNITPGAFGPENIPLSAEFANLFTPGDIRIVNYFNMDPTRAGGLVGTAGKVLKWEWPTDGTVPFPLKRGNAVLFKPEEAYLMLAEAYYRLNDVSNSVGTLNKFKTFRNAGSATGLTGQSLLTEIINERRKEFFTDTDKRWLDLKRYAYKTITRTHIFFGKTYTITVPPHDFRYSLPIPLTEIQLNPAIIPNEGWTPIEY